MYARPFCMQTVVFSVQTVVFSVVFHIGILPVFSARAQDMPPKNPADAHAPNAAKTLPAFPKRMGLGFLDPAQSYMLPLLKREDVQAQIFLSPRQREALDALDIQQQQAMQQQIAQTLPSLEELTGKSLEELRASLAERSEKRRTTLQNLYSDRDKKMAAILTPTQWKRLKELDLQWRGPLAIGSKDVADQVKLTPQQAPIVAGLLTQYQQEASRRRGLEVSATVLKQKADAEAEAEADNASSPSETQTRMEKATLELEKTRRQMGDRALNALTPEQRAQWSALTGKPFVFRN